MQPSSKISHGALRNYFETDFARARDFGPAWDGDQLVETQQTNGSFILMDKQGSPELLHRFAHFMDENDSDASASYAEMAAAYDSLRKPTGNVNEDDRRHHLHMAITWLSFERRKGMTQEAFAERLGVNVRTVHTWVKQAVTYVHRQLTMPALAEVVTFPSSYEPIPQVSHG
jgi:DNA-binding transcriptional regulator YiaG